MEPTGEIRENQIESFPIYEGPIDYYFRSIGIEEGTHIADDLKEGIKRTSTATGSVEKTDKVQSAYTGVATATGIDRLTRQDIEALVDWVPEGRDPLSKEDKVNATDLVISYLNGAKWSIQSEGQAIPNNIQLALVQYSDEDYAKQATHAFYDTEKHTVNFNRDTLLLAAKAPNGIQSNMDINHTDKAAYLEYKSQPHELHGLEKQLEDARLEAVDNESVKSYVGILEGLINEVNQHPDHKKSSAY